MFDAAAAGELKRLPDSIGNIPGVVEEPMEPIDEPIKEGISPTGAAGKNIKILLTGKCYLGRPWYQTVVE